MKYSLFTLTLLLFLSCKLKKSVSSTDSIQAENTASQEEVNMVMEPPVVNENQADLVISFYSPGDGINYKAKADLDSYLSKNKEIVFSTHNWGREGEIDYCFDLKSLNYKTKQKVLTEIKQLIGVQNKVRYMVNSECYHKN
jgi:hypothetical protein